MSNKEKQCDLKTMWQFYCNSPGAIPALKNEVQKLVDQHDQIENSLANQQRQLFELCEQIASVKRDAPKQIAKLALTSKIDAEQFASNLSDLESDKELLQLMLDLRQPALNSPKADYLFLVSKYKDDLIQWVALQRCKDVLACGQTMPVEVVTMWHKLGVRFHKMPEGVDLNTNVPIMPIHWFFENTANFRACLAWLWFALAGKQFKWKPKARNSNEHWLQITADLDELPTVPKQQRAPKPIKW